MTFDPRPVQAELLLPHQLSAALDARSLVYLPLGSIEWHSHHLPVGLDGLTAHGLCARAAAHTGGIVLPTLYYGTGGGHTAYPWTVMIEDTAILKTLVNRSLTKLAEFGVRTAVIFTGHFADEQLAMIAEIADAWPAESPLTVTALSINGNAAAGIAPDHAGMFESSLLQAMSPELVQLDRLPSLADAPADDPGGDPAGPHRHRVDHPLYGVFGPDPRHLDTSTANRLLEEMVHWMTNSVEAIKSHSTAFA